MQKQLNFWYAVKHQVLKLKSFVLSAIDVLDDLIAYRSIDACMVN